MNLLIYILVQVSTLHPAFSYAKFIYCDVSHSEVLSRVHACASNPVPGAEYRCQFSCKVPVVQIASSSNHHNLTTASTVLLGQ